MNNSSNFVRKIIYIVAIGVLLIPLSLVSRPATRSTDGGAGDMGGQLAQLRDEEKLSQTRLMDIDPASETMKLASLGLRGVAVNLLWMQAIEHKKKEQYDQLASTLKALTKIQPNFVKVWEYQAHNMAYNISMEFDDYEYRYHWVKKGISFLQEGIPYNRSDHRMKEHLGYYTGMKIGRSDEKVQFRRMFREDTPFHESMEEYINPDDYDTREYGHDNWKMAFYWYRLAVKMVEDAKSTQYTSDARFYMHPPAQLRNQGLALGEEFRTDEIIQDVWRGAADAWDEYGRTEIRNTYGVTITMEGVMEYQQDVERLQDQLDELAPPGLRDEFMKEIMSKVELTELEEEALAVEPDQRDDAQFVRAIRAGERIAKEDRGINLMIFKAVSEEKKKKAKVVYDGILRAKTRIGAVGTHDSVTNFRYWRVRNRAEASEVLVLARQAMFDAQEIARQSIFDDEYEFNYETKERTVVRRGAISLYLDAFAKFNQALDDFPMLRSGELSEVLIESIQEYKGLLDLSGMEWPDEFPLQKLIDVRAALGEDDDGLPTTEYLEELRSGKEEIQDDVQPEKSNPDAPNSIESKQEELKSDAEVEKSKTEAAGEDDATSKGAKNEEEKSDDQKS